MIAKTKVRVIDTTEQLYGSVGTVVSIARAFGERPETISVRFGIDLVVWFYATQLEEALP